MRRLLGLLWVAFALAPAAAQTPAPPDAGEIFDRARAVWRAQQYPPLLRYQVVLHYRTGSDPITLTHEALWRRSDDRIFVKAISKEEDEHPHTPHGTNFGLLGLSLTHEFFEPFGVPELSPAYAFGLSAAPRGKAIDKSETGESLKQVGSVRIVARDYYVTLIGMESCPDSSTAYHLGLKAVTKPDRYPLRDIWVKPDSFETCRLRTEHNFAESPIGTGRWEITFAQSQLGTLIESEQPLDPLTFRKHDVMDASIHFEHVEAARPDVHTDLWLLGLSGTQGDVTREPEER